MTALQTKSVRTRHNIFAATLARFIDARQSHRNRQHSGPVQFPFVASRGADSSAQTPDPISVAVFAIDQVGPAAVRACASGVEVRITAADEATAAVIRAALAETARRRPTDRLIHVVID